MLLTSSSVGLASWLPNFPKPVTKTAVLLEWWLAWRGAEFVFGFISSKVIMVPPIRAQFVTMT